MVSDSLSSTKHIHPAMFKSLLPSRTNYADSSTAPLLQYQPHRDDGSENECYCGPEVVQQRSRNEFVERMRRRVSTWLSQSQADRVCQVSSFELNHLESSQFQIQNQQAYTLASWLDHDPDVRYSNLHFNPYVQLEFADDQLDAYLEEEYKDLGGDYHTFYPSHDSHQDIVLLPPFRNVVRPPPRATRYGYRQRSSLSVIPEE
jgi:hypothetical protein